MIVYQVKNIHLCSYNTKQPNDRSFQVCILFFILYTDLSKEIIEAVWKPMPLPTNNQISSPCMLVHFLTWIPGSKIAQGADQSKRALLQAAVNCFRHLLSLPVSIQNPCTKSKYFSLIGNGHDIFYDLLYIFVCHLFYGIHVHGMYANPQHYINRKKTLH